MFDKLIEKIGYQNINELVGVDIGTASIKICVLEKTKKGLKLSHLAKKTYAENLLRDGLIIDNDTVARALKNLLLENKIKGKYAACALSSYCVITKKLSMPLLEQRTSERSVKASSNKSLITKKSALPLFEDENIIEAEVENIIPFPLKEIVYSYHIMGLGQENENTVDVLIAAAKKQTVDGFVNTFRTAGLNLVILDVDIFALTNIVEQINNPKDSSIVVVDIGASVTNMAIIKGENIEFTREILLGGGYLTSQIEKSLKLSFEDAEQKKIKGDDDVLYLFEDFIFTIASEINKTINFYTSTNPNETLGKIYLSGGTSLLCGLIEKIREYTNIDVQYLNPFAILSKNPHPLNEELKQFDIYEDYKEFNAIAMQLSSRILELE